MAANSFSKNLYLPIARTVSPTAEIQNDINHPRLGGHFIIRTSAVGAAPSVVPSIEAQDPLSAIWYSLLTGVAITAIGTTILKIYPGLTPVANAVASDFIPPVWRFSMTHGNSDSITYSVAANLRN